MKTATNKKEQPQRSGILLVDAKEIAELLGTSRRHVLDLAAKDQLPHLRLGRFVRFRKESVEKWAEAVERWPSGDRNGATR